MDTPTMPGLRAPLPPVDEVTTTEVVVVGGGVAGLSAALGCAPRSVALVVKTALDRGGASGWAQGGVAAAVGEDDSPGLHADDTVAAAAGLADRRAVERVTADGPGRIAELIALGARFDREPGGGLALGREAAHSRRRILHADGDATGAELVRTLVAEVRRTPGIAVHERELAVELVLAPHPAGDRVVGVLARTPGGRLRLHLAPAVVLATGGIGRLWAATTNPPEATGDGLAMAARAGARLADLEMVQFHPTALAAGLDPLPLLTEALRGEGAVLLDGRGRRFLAALHPAAELAPRDVVARAIGEHLAAGEPVFLDARRAVGEAFPGRFPTVFAACRRAGLDPRREPLPVSPAAHYHMGGIDVDLAGRTSVAGLWACGEVASTGLHGANRLASNSLLEGLVFGARVADDLRGRLAAVPGSGGGELSRLVAAVPAVAEPALAAGVRRRMWDGVGLVRSATGMSAVAAALGAIPLRPATADDPRAAHETANLIAIGRLVTAAALARRESRGAHARADFPGQDATLARRLRWRLAADGAPVEVTEVGERPAAAGAGWADRRPGSATVGAGRAGAGSAR